MNHVIEYCHGNMGEGRGISSMRTDGDVKGRRCLEQCGICLTERFLIVDGDLIRGDEIDTTLDQIQEESVE